jgi:tyrosine phenol-lyase
MPISTAQERQKWVIEAGYNMFNLRSPQVMIDLLTDSGTVAMSDQQWAEMIRADEAYAGSKTFYDLESAAKNIMGMEYVLPVHQGRAAEHLLFSTILKGGELIPSNSHFDTTLANIQDQGADGINLLCPEGLKTFEHHPFKGNMDLEKLEALLAKEGNRIPLVMITITNNTAGGQPVSLENITGAAEITHRYKKMFVIDACRFAENAYFIKQREPKYANLTPLEISRKMFAFGDAATFSGKKDALSNIGGLLCLRDGELVDRLKTRLLVTEGFPTYGGMAGYSMAAMAQGLKEVLDERYLHYRLRTIEWMVERLEKAGIPVIVPAGGHAVYLESARFFPHIPQEQFPGIALTTALYIKAGVRSCELGTVAFGKRDETTGRMIPPPLDLVRLAIPRRTYTEAHMGHVVECLKEIYLERDQYRGFKFLKEYDVLRHFRSTFEQL